MKSRLLLLLFLTLAWLVPIVWTGWMGRLPVKVNQRLSSQYAPGGLFFPPRTDRWVQMRIQVRMNGSTQWKTIDTAELSPMGAFGYRQRWDRILQETNGRPVANEVRQRLSEWTARCYDELHPGEGGVRAVRFGATVWAANSPDLARPSGHWVTNPPAGKPLAQFPAMAAFSIEEGRAKAIPTGSAGHARPDGPRAPAAPPPIGKRFRPGRGARAGASPAALDSPPKPVVEPAAPLPAPPRAP